MISKACIKLASEWKKIAHELKEHSPFTFFGTFTGLVLLLIFYKLPFKTAYDIFYVLHPLHILFSSVVTTSIYKIYNPHAKLWILFLIGYAGSVGLGTLSDSIIPFLGEIMLNLPQREIHVGFIEEWWLVNPLALLGILAAYIKPTTKYPHALHVFLSTWASLFHIIMALGAALNLIVASVIFVFLFIAVLLPCCTSDIVFPLLFVKETAQKNEAL